MPICKPAIARMCAIPAPPKAPASAGGSAWVSPVEASLINLATNACDAMPKGSRLTIATGNRTLDADYAALHDAASAGDHVMIEVSDTGCGMSQPVLARVFEPFFATKEPGKGKGSGHGHAMVFGLMKQSQGPSTSIASRASARRSGSTSRAPRPRPLPMPRPRHRWRPWRAARRCWPSRTMRRCGGSWCGG